MTFREASLIEGLVREPGWQAERGKQVWPDKTVQAGNALLTQSEHLDRLWAEACSGRQLRHTNPNPRCPSATIAWRRKGPGARGPHQECTNPVPSGKPLPDR